MFCVLSSNDQLVVPEAVIQPTPSTLTWTFATATLSYAVPEIEIVPTSVEPFVGVLIDNVGGVRSATVLVEVTK